MIEVWPFWLGGGAIGLFLLVLLVVGGKPLGVSTGYEDACSAPFNPAVRGSWRIWFLLGIVGGGVLSGLLSGGIEPTLAMGMFDTTLGSSLWLKSLMFMGGGILIGFGARLAGGCTSGHSIMGISQLAPSSIIATIGFMVSGVIVANIVYRFIGGA